MPLGHPLILFGADRTIATVNVSESLTIPDTINTTSPTSQYQPSAVAGTFDTRRPSVGGQTLLAFSDAAGPNNTVAFEHKLNPGDVISCSAVVSNVVTVSVTPAGGVAQVLGKITGVTTKAGVILVYG